MQNAGIRRSFAASMVVLLAGCGGQGPSSAPSATAAALASTAAIASAPAPSLTPAATATAAATASPTATPAPRPLAEYPRELNWANDIAMRVIVSDLNVRVKPSTSAAKIAKAPKGSVFLFSNWPVQKNGFQWFFGYQAQLRADGSLPPLPESLTGAGVDPLTGWVAAGTSDAPYLEPLAPRCPSRGEIDLAHVEAMLDSEQISCFGSDQIELTATYGCGGCGGSAPGDFAPSWLAYPLGYSFLSEHPALRIGPLGIRFPPSGDPAPPEGTIIRVRAHFSDSRSSTCRIAPLGDGDAPDPIPADLAEAYCRAQLIADSFDVLGTDPTFNGG